MRTNGARVMIGKKRGHENAGNIGTVMNITALEGHKAKIEYDPEFDVFRGAILGFNVGADFCGKSQFAAIEWRTACQMSR
jgi:hypothetical protein